MRFTKNFFAGFTGARTILSRTVDATLGRRFTNRKLDEIKEEDWLRTSEATSDAEILGITEAAPENPGAESFARAEIEAAEGSQNDSAGVLSIHNLAKAYKSRRVVEDVSLHVRRGEAVGLLGPNGAGKTTVFYMITGLVKPDKGIISLDGYDVTPLPMYRRARLGHRLFTAGSFCFSRAFG